MDAFDFFEQCAQADFPPSIFSAVKRVSCMPGVIFDGCYYKYQNSFVVRLVLDLNLPTRYINGSGLVYKEEPVFVKFHQDYPDKVPVAYIGRKDFHFNKTPHIYCERNGLHPICLFRGNADEWFATMEIEDFIKHLRSWYEDLASVANLLNGFEFEPLRLSGYTGQFIYDYELMTVSIDKNFHKGFLLCTFLKLSSHTYFKYPLDKFPANTLNELLFLQGIIYWDTSSENHDEYDVDLPHTFGELKIYSKKHGINVDSLCLDIQTIWLSKHSIKSEMKFIEDKALIILGIRRSRKLIGVNSKYQFVNFEVSLSVNEEGVPELDDNSKVSYCVHESMLTREKAHEISMIPVDLNPSILFAGCGALGSKVAMHLVRSGLTNIIFCDPDKFTNFNLSRHVLFPNSIGKNKAEELCNLTNTIYVSEGKHAISSKLPIKQVLSILSDSKEYQKYYVLDFSASKVVFNQLVLNSSRPKVISAAIYDEGKFGLLLCEDSLTNNRIDDLIIAYYSLYSKIQEISLFLQTEKKHSQGTNSILTVGLGCNSETFILSDDVISLFASAMSITLKSIFAGKHSGGCWQYKIGEDGNLRVTKMDIPRFTIIKDSSWEIHISEEVLQRINSESIYSSPCETGGYLIGQCNMKTNRIFVVDLLSAPSDTICSENSLVLGKKDYNRNINRIARLSGSTFGYVGEWHSHPHGPDFFSETDVQEFEAKISEMRRNGDIKPILELLKTPTDLIAKVLTII